MQNLAEKIENNGLFVTKFPDRLDVFDKDAKDQSRNRIFVVHRQPEAYLIADHRRPTDAVKTHYVPYSSQAVVTQILEIMQN